MANEHLPSEQLTHLRNSIAQLIESTNERDDEPQSPTVFAIQAIHGEAARMAYQTVLNLLDELSYSTGIEPGSLAS